MTDGPGMGKRRGVAGAAIALFAAAVLLSACGKPAQDRASAIAPRAANETRPNILVIQVDHLGPELGAYGDAAADTPHIDQLAHDGVTFTSFYGASGGEDAETAALLTGMHPSTIGMVQEWADQAAWTVAPPPEVRGYPELLRAAGYDTFHVGARPDPFGGSAALWAHEAKKPGETWPGGVLRQPFLGIVDLSTHDAEKKKTFWDRLAFWRKQETAATRTNPAPITQPPYLPATPAVRDELDAEYARVHRVDDAVGTLMQRLRDAGVLDHTIIIFTAKSGPARPRAERTIYDSGARLPLIVRWPDHHGAGTVRQDLVSGIDVAPAILRMGGVAPRAWMQGQDHLSGADAANTFVFTVQNRVDNAYERVFAVRDGRYLYVLNLSPYISVLQLARPGALTDAVAAARKAGRLTRGQAQAFSDDRSQTELYDLKSDPYELTNIAADPAHAGDVARLAQVLDAFVAEAPDYSTDTTRDLNDLFKPGGVTPVTAAPQGAVRRGVVMLSSMTPGAAILWRTTDKGPWTLYTAPFAAPSHGVEAKAVRYGFVESTVVEIGR